MFERVTNASDFGECVVATRVGVFESFEKECTSAFAQAQGVGRLESEWPARSYLGGSLVEETESIELGEGERCERGFAAAGEASLSHVGF